MIPHGWTEGFTAFLRNGRMANQVAALQMKKAKAKLPGSITNPRLAVLHLALRYVLQIPLWSSKSSRFKFTPIKLYGTQVLTFCTPRRWIPQILVGDFGVHKNTLKNTADTKQPAALVLISAGTRSTSLYLYLTHLASSSHLPKFLRTALAEFLVFG